MRLFRRVGAIAVVAISSLAAPILVADGALSAPAVSPAPSAAERTYLVQVPDGQLPALQAELHSLGEKASETFTQGPETAVVSITAAQAAEIKADLPHAIVSANHIYRLADTQSSPSWNLAALNQTDRNPVSSYTYPTSAGSGVDVYVIDTGVELAASTNPGSELYGRVLQGRNFVLEAGWPATNADDCWSAQHAGGHGTHVAGLVASTTYGVAKSATIVPLRVFACPVGTHDASTDDVTVTAALDWAIANKRAGHPSVINMSLGGTASDVLDAKVEAAVSAGFTVVVAAGNSSADACQTSPARAPDAITVGSFGSGLQASSFSNFGSCVSLFAPGENVPSLQAWDLTRPLSLNGTSMATPQAAGAAALYLSQHPEATPAQVKTALTGSSLEGLLTWPAGWTDAGKAASPNKMLNLGLMNGTITTAAAPATLSVTATSASAIALAWSAPVMTNGLYPVDYRVDYRPAGSGSWTTSNDGVSSATTTTVAGLAPKSRYEFTVTAITQQGVTSSASSPVVAGITQSGIPSAVRSLKLSVRATTSLTFAWATPANLNGGVIGDYIVTYRRLGTSKWYTFKDGVSTRRTAKLTGLRRWTSYQVRIYPKTAQGLGSVATLTPRTR
jgi:subtilisin family serine protease